MLKILPLALIAILLGVAATEFPNPFEIPKELQLDANAMTAEQSAQLEAVKNDNAQKHHAIMGAIIGAVFAGCLALGGSLLAKRGIPIATISGVILGGVGGAIGGYASTYLLQYFRIHEQDQFVEALSIHGSFFIPIAIGLSVALIISKSMPPSPALTLVIVAAIGSGLYPLLAAIAFPLLQSDRVPPMGSANRALWLGLPILFIAATMIRQKPTEQASDAETTAEKPAPVPEPESDDNDSSDEA
ncbi:hypothetical protein KOR42_08570 [Thalassoglobus neptunius]|uniref:Uncharacterized protein n=1 Tax=Thalassoglobus neptunius TaxID=1938619 RepID=A0A5C5X3G7_9PLAN|nr:hypothetical protein [Thalassoglobus neptunius]TWT57496.1 hypothetical protein KOR42_08570 [Thalassoglobus neptunius]